MGQLKGSKRNWTIRSLDKHKKCTHSDMIVHDRSVFFGFSNIEWKQKLKAARREEESDQIHLHQQSNMQI